MDLDAAPRAPSVVELAPPWITAYLGDNVVHNGRLLRLNGPGDQTDACAVVTRQIGRRTVEAIALPFPDWLAEGIEIAPIDATGYLSYPSPGKTPIPDLELLAEETRHCLPFRSTRPEFSDLSGQLVPVPTGFEYVDIISPVAGGGMTVVLDNAEQTDPYENLVQAVAANTTYQTLGLLKMPSWSMPDRKDDEVFQLTIDSSHPDIPPQNQLFVGLRALLAWSAAWRDRDNRDLLIVADLPPIQYTEETDDGSPNRSIGEIITRLGSGLASTHSAQVTTLLRLPLRRSEYGLDHIADRLDLGDVDAQIFIDRQGQFDPRRSLSNATLEGKNAGRRQRIQSTLHRALKLEDTRQILGKAGLTSDQQKTLAEAEQYKQPLT